MSDSPSDQIKLTRLPGEPAVISDMETIRKCLQTAYKNTKRAMDIINKTKEPHRKLLFRRIIITAADLNGIVSNYDSLLTPSSTVEVKDFIDKNPEATEKYLAESFKEEITKDKDMRNEAKRD